MIWCKDSDISETIKRDWEQKKIISQLTDFKIKVVIDYAHKISWRIY